MLAENFGQSWLTVDLPFACEIHHTHPRATPDAQRFRVLSHFGEPGPLRWPAAEVRAHHRHFDLIVTADESLADLPNAQFMIFGDAWVTEPPPRKEFSLSFLYSAGIRAAFDGYAMRARLWAQRDQLAIPKRYWYSTIRPPQGLTADDQPYPAEKKDLLFESMFSVIVENVTERHYFSEKILDALQTYTVPVYYGCPNIAEHFDTRGMIVFRSEAEFLEQANALTPADYWSRLPWLQANRERSMAFCKPVDRLRQAIVERHALLNEALAA